MVNHDRGVESIMNVTRDLEGSVNDVAAGVQSRVRDTVIPESRELINRASKLLTLQVKLADTFVGRNRPDLAEKLAHELKETLHLRRRMHLHLQAVETVADNYAFHPGTTTDFGEQIQDKTSQLANRSGFDYRAAEEYHTYLECLSRVGTVGSSGGVLGSNEARDEEVEVMEGEDFAAPNAHCPVSGKALEELVWPVVDPVGFIYERDALYKYISDFWHDRDEELMELDEGIVKCPVAGTSHVVKRDELKPAFGLIRGLKRKRRQAAPETETDVI